MLLLEWNTHSLKEYALLLGTKVFRTEYLASVFNL